MHIHATRMTLPACTTDLPEPSTWVHHPRRLGFLNRLVAVIAGSTPRPFQLCIEAWFLFEGWCFPGGGQFPVYFWRFSRCARGTSTAVCFAFPRGWWGNRWSKPTRYLSLKFFGFFFNAAETGFDAVVGGPFTKHGSHAIVILYNLSIPYRNEDGTGLWGQRTILISGWAAIVAASRRWYFSAVQVIFVIVSKSGGSGCSSSFTLTKRYTGN